MREGELKWKVLIVAASAALVLAGHAPVAQARTRRFPNSYCSPSGDLCESTGKVAGVRRVRIRVASPRFDRYTLCVKTPRSPVSVCRTHRLHRWADGFSGDSMRARRFSEGRGIYKFEWFRGPYAWDVRKLGTTLGFRR